MTFQDGWLESLRERFVPKSGTAEEMSAIDQNSTALGVPVQSLMENAGAGVAAVVEKEFGAGEKRILVVAGTGNKGGDGFVASRHLLNRGARVSLVLLGTEKEIRSQEARANWQVLRRLLGLTIFSIQDSSGLRALKGELSRSDLVVDAMLGTGVNGALREPFASSVELLNSSGKPIVSIDTPTGLNPSTGEVQGTAVRAKVTVTLHKSKTGFRGNTQLTGKIRVMEIGIPAEAELLSGPGDLARVTTPRKSFASKRDYGYVLVVGGSDIYSGAPGLTGLASLRTGAGLCIIAAPEGVCGVIRSFSPDLIAHALPGHYFETRHVRYIKENLLPRVSTVVLGPGIGSHDETARAVRTLAEAVSDSKLPLVIDADAIRSFTGQLDMIRNAGKVILTPNAGEFKAIAGLEVGDDLSQRVEQSVKLAKEAGCTILLKGDHSVITDSRRLKINTTGNPAMAVGGTGDVLSGIIAAYLAQGIDTFWAAVAGAYAHARAGDLASEDKGYHILASDLIEELPLVLKPFDRPS